jgi:hypothetical protein
MRNLLSSLMVACFIFAAIGLNSSVHMPISRAAVTGPYDLALLRVRFTDSTDTLYTTGELTTAAGEMHDFFDQLSFGQLDMRVRVADVTVSGTWDDYLHCTAGASCPVLIEDAAENAAAAGFDFTGVEGILIVRAGCRENNGWTSGTATISRPGVSGTFQQSYDVECGRSSLPSTVSWGGWVHEIGHQLEGQEGRWDLTHLTGYESGYNLMDSCYPCGESSFSLAPEILTNETGAIAGKLLFPGWLPDTRIRQISSTTGTGETVVLSPIEENLGTTTAALGIKIPIARGQYYFLEARRGIRVDSFHTMYDEGIQIIRIDEAGTGRLGDTIDTCDSLVPGGCIRTDDRRCDGATAASQPACWPFPLWHTGNTFRDDSNNIAISIGPQTGNGWAVTVTRGVPPGRPDLYLTPWLTPPMSSYETTDIWVDSSCNGYESAGGTLRYGRRADGTVVGNGDDPCANHENRVYAVIRNIGDAPASMANVTIEVSDPLGMGISGTWRSLGTVSSSSFPELGSIPAGGQAIVFVNWTPSITLSDVEIRDSRFSFHSCLRVRASAVSGELVTSNLDGDGEQENIDSFEVSAGRSSGMRRSERSFRISNAHDPKQENKERTYYFLVQADLPSDWQYEIAGGAKSITLRPGESRDIPVRIISDGVLQPGMSWHLKVAAYSLERMVPPPFVRTQRVEFRPKIAGGVDFGAQAVEDAKISIQTNLREVVAVEGRLDPPVKNAWVTIDYTPTAGDTISHVVTTDDSGTFRDATVKAGRAWRVRAFWQGSATLSSAVSETIIVGKDSHLWWWLILIFILILLFVLLFIWLRRHKRRSV